MTNVIEYLFKPLSYGQASENDSFTRRTLTDYLYTDVKQLKTYRVGLRSFKFSTAQAYSTQRFSQDMRCHELLVEVAEGVEIGLTWDLSLIHI